MPSQDDNLEDLLKELAGEEDDIFGGSDSGLELRDPLEMTEDEINSFLEEREAAARPSVQKTTGDVLDLKDDGDSDLQEIQEMLKKSDRNEAVDVSGDSRKEENLADRLMEDIEKAGAAEMAGAVVDSKKERAQEKKRLKEEKKAAREAAKAQKKAQRRAKKKGSRREGGQSEKWEPLPEPPAETAQEYDVVQDKDLLDSIVAEAGKADRTEWEAAPQVDLMEVAAALEAERNVDISQEVPYAEENMASKAEHDAGVLALGLDEIDNYIPDITDSVKEQEPKKKSAISKFVDFLMEEEEEPENENVQISDENQEIIREMDSEEAEKVKKKVKKKEKKKEKTKKAKDKKKKEPKPKKPKEPKPKKEKKPKEPDPYPVKKLGFKKVLPVVLLGVSVGAAIFIVSILSADYSNKQTAKNAFDSGDYQACYTYLHGKKLNETQKQMYNKSECILHIGMWYREYELLEAEGSELQALDSLIQSVHDYPELLVYAFKWDAGAEVNAVYVDILNVLYEKYGITEARAQEIAALESDIEYTRAVMDAAETAGYWEGIGVAEGQQAGNAGSLSGQSGSTDASAGQGLSDGAEDSAGQTGEAGDAESSSEVQPDELPEEAEMESEEFVDNQ